MWKVIAPTANAEYSFRTSISSHIADADLKARLEAITPDVVGAETDYITAASQGLLNTIVPLALIGGVTRTELEDVYTSRMAKKGAPGRPIYDQLLSAPAYGRCPLCGQRRVSTLDHHLPKALYPVLAVTPVNLVPACKDCNTAKLAFRPTLPEEVFFHPYFDDLDDARWLIATVVTSTPPSVLFEVDEISINAEVLRARVTRQFRALRLAELYASYAAEELVNIQAQLRTIHNAAGEVMVREHLRGQADSYEEARRNSWQTAMYRALQDSAWYCDGGFEF